MMKVLRLRKISGACVSFVLACSGMLRGQDAEHSYRNPLSLNSKLGPAVSCPDPAITKERGNGEDTWYLYCTGDPLNSHDVDANGNLVNHLIASYRSLDLIHWTYIGDVLPALPAWMGNVVTNLWAPAVKYFNGQYYLYYVAPTTQAGGPAIGVATSKHPGGPWIDSGKPVVPPEANPYNGAPGRSVIDPDEVEDQWGQRYISYGSFFGGISIRKLSADGVTSDASSEQQIAVDNVFEGGNFYQHDGFYYLFVSTSSCCDGPLSGYSVAVGRSQNPTGPFLDKNGVSLVTFAPGGFISIAANGNKWVGPGGNVVFADDSGQDYMLYHAVDVDSPYFDGYPGFTRRPALLDPIEWVDGWPEVRGGYWASATQQPAPAAQSWQDNDIRRRIKPEDVPGRKMDALSDEFNGPALSKQWHFLHPLADNTYVLTGGAYQVETRGPDENGDPQHVSILAEPTPVKGDYLVETRVTTTIPFDSSCCYNFAQGALFIYGDDGNSIKLDVFADYDTRQTEFGKQVTPVPANYPGYDHMTVGPMGITTWLRIVKHGANDGLELYTAYTSNDGEHWTKGATWRHNLGSGAQIGISAQNVAGFTVDFDYVRVFRLKEQDRDR